MFYFTFFWHMYRSTSCHGLQPNRYWRLFSSIQIRWCFCYILTPWTKEYRCKFPCLCFCFILGSEHAFCSPNLMVLGLDLRYLYGTSPEMTQMPFLIRPCKVQPIVVYIEAFPLPVQNQVDEHQVVAKRYVSILWTVTCFFFYGKVG